MSTDNTDKPIISALGVAAIAKEVWGNPIPKEAYAFAEKLQAEMASKQAEQARHLEDSLRHILSTISSAFSPTDDSVSSDDLVEEIGNVCRDEFAGRLADLKFGIAYNGSEFAYGENIPEAIFNHQTLKELAVAGWTVAEMPSSYLQGKKRVNKLFPTHADLVAAADSALDRGSKYEFRIGAENAAEVMREELALDGFDELPPQFDAICSAAMMAAIERAQEEPRERGGE